MSDHRFELDVTFSIYGETFHWESSLNWAPPDVMNPYNGEIDSRITEWFADCYAKARAGYDSAMEAHRAQENERWEREQLARLKAKYEQAAG